MNIDQIVTKGKLKKQLIDLKKEITEETEKELINLINDIELLKAEIPALKTYVEKRLK